MREETIVLNGRNEWNRLKKDCELQFKREWNHREKKSIQNQNHTKLHVQSIPFESLKQQIIPPFLSSNGAFLIVLLLLFRNKLPTHTKVHLLAPSIRADSRKKIRDVSGKPAISHLLPSLLRWTRPPKTASR